MTHRFNATILREYDIRGIVGRTLSEEDAYALGRTFASEGRDQGAKRLAVGRDGREHSPGLEDALVRGLTEGGLDVVRIGQGPSPMLYWAVAELDVDGGIQITGSHNPAEYNGFKMLLPGGSVFGFTNVRVNGHVEREINVEQAAVVRRIFALSAEGAGLTRIAKQLNAEGAATPTPKKGRPAAWSPSSVREILHRQLYIGKIIYNKTRRRAPDGSSTSRSGRKASG